MGIFKGKASKKLASKADVTDTAKTVTPVAPPTLARRKLNQHSTIRSGRTIGERRERLETRNERMAARKKDKKKAAWRVILTIVGFVALGGILVYLCFYLFRAEQPSLDDASNNIEEVGNNDTLQPTIEVVDEDATVGGKISSRMNAYIGQAEQDFRDLNYTPVKAVIPTGAIREVDFYLEGYDGFIKTTIDRDSAITVEDADRMIRYLADQGTDDFEYIDVRIDRRAYWK